jgi:hypothetical protein
MDDIVQELRKLADAIADEVGSKDCWEVDVAQRGAIEIEQLRAAITEAIEALETWGCDDLGVLRFGPGQKVAAFRALLANKR